MVRCAAAALLQCGVLADIGTVNANRVNLDTVTEHFIASEWDTHACPPVKAFVLNLDPSLPRYHQTIALLKNCSIPVVRVQPVPHDDVRLRACHGGGAGSAACKVESNGRTQANIWDMIANGTALDCPRQWGMVVEDDIALRQEVRPREVSEVLEKAKAVGKDSGFFYMGACGGYLQNYGKSVATLALASGPLTFGRGFGSCAHAYVLNATTAAGFRGFLYPDIPDGPFGYVDSKMRNAWRKHNGVVVAGVNFRYSGNQHGVFYQVPGRCPDDVALHALTPAPRVRVLLCAICDVRTANISRQASGNLVALHEGRARP